MIVASVPRHGLVSLDDERGWSEALSGLPHAPGHTREWCRAMHHTTGWDTFLYAFTNGATRVICPIAERPWGSRTDITTPPGFSGFVAVGPTAGFADEWLRYARERRWVSGYIGLNPVLANGVEDLPAIPHHTVYSLDLRLPADELIGRMDRNRRRQLRVALDPGNPIVTDRAELTDFIVREYPAFAARSEIALSRRLGSATLRELCGASNSILAGAMSGGVLEAAYLIVYTPYAADSVLSVSVPGGQHHAVRLLWHGVTALRRIGVPVLNLGGGVRPGDSIASFKERFGPAVHPLESVRQVYDPEAYAALCRERGADPGDRDGYFPAYRSDE